MGNASRENYHRLLFYIVLKSIFFFQDYYINYHQNFKINIELLTLISYNNFLIKSKLNFR